MSASGEVATWKSPPYDEELYTKEPVPAVYIKLFVGPEKQLFEMNENLICTRCPFFFNAFCGDYLEAKTKTLDLVDDDPDRFQELQAWLNGETVPNASQTWLALSRTWLFADKYHIDELQNAIVDAIYHKYVLHETGINIAFETLDYIALHTFPRSPLRLLFADMLVNGTSLQQIPNRFENVPHEFMQEIWLSLKSHVDRNGPANVALLSNRLSAYYVSSAVYRATAMPKAIDQADIATGIVCQGLNCQDLDPPTLIRDTMHICSNHNVTLCHNCRHSHRGHRKKMMTLTSPPYRNAATGSMTITDAQMNDSGFFCDGPKCDTRLKDFGLPDWALMSGDRYHCLVCNNTDFCNSCVRGELDCKNEGHAMLRIRSTFSRKTADSTEAVSIVERQRRLGADLCVKCASEGHTASDCKAKKAVLGADIVVEE